MVFVMLMFSYNFTIMFHYFDNLFWLIYWQFSYIYRHSLYINISIFFVVTHSTLCCKSPIRSINEDNKNNVKMLWYQYLTKAQYNKFHSLTRDPIQIEMKSNWFQSTVGTSRLKKLFIAHFKAVTNLSNLLFPSLLLDVRLLFIKFNQIKSLIWLILTVFNETFVFLYNQNKLCLKLCHWYTSYVEHVSLKRY